MSDNMDVNEQNLDNFLNATDNISNFIALLAPTYPRMLSKYNSLIDETWQDHEEVTPLEIVAQEGKVEHVKALLHANVVGLPEHKKAACLRAIEAGETQTVMQLLDERLIDDLSKIKINQRKPTHKYLNEVTNPSHYPTRYNKNVKPEGNVALVMAASLPDATIFNRLLENDLLKKQLPESGIVAFLAATRHPDGTPKMLEQVNKDIINQLLTLPHVHEYVASRPYDFAELLTPQNAVQTPNAPNEANKIGKIHEKLNAHITMSQAIASEIKKSDSTDELSTSSMTSVESSSEKASQNSSDPEIKTSKYRQRLYQVINSSDSTDDLSITTEEDSQSNQSSP